MFSTSLFFTESFLYTLMDFSSIISNAGIGGISYAIEGAMGMLDPSANLRGTVGAE